MIYFFICLCITLIGYFLLKFFQRNVFAGILFASGILLSVISLFFLLLEQIYLHFHNGDVITMIIAYLILPIVFIIICGYFIFNSKIMRTKEGKSATSKLSALLGINLLITLPALFELLVAGPFRLPIYIFDIILYILMVDIIFSFLFAAYIFYSWMYQMVPFKQEVDYIIVLGSGIRSEEVPPLLKSRLDKGIEYYDKNQSAKFVVSGGKGEDEPVSEAFAMRKYLLSQNIPEDRILVEDKSTTTYENMLFSKQVIEDDLSKKDNHQTKSPTIIFTTNNYHVLRGSMYAHRVHLKAEGVGAPTALYFLPTALIREYIALLFHNKKFTIGLLFVILLLIIWTSLPI